MVTDSVVVPKKITENYKTRSLVNKYKIYIPGFQISHIKETEVETIKSGINIVRANGFFLSVTYTFTLIY